MVAVGSLDRVWLGIPEEGGEKELQEAFSGFFGATWAEVLAAADNSFEYNCANTVYFSVRYLRPVENGSLEELIEKIAPIAVPNIIAS